MTYYSRKLQININAKNAKTIEECIRIYEERTNLLKKWKEKGIYLDTNKKNDESDVLFFTTDLMVANEEGFSPVESKSGIQYHTYKIGIYSKFPIIKEQFLKTIHAMGVPRGKDSFLSYKIQENHYSLHFHSILGTSAISTSSINKYMKNSNFQGIIHFYHIKFDMNREFRQILKFIKWDSRYPVPILFVGYDSILPPNPEDLDKNIPIIKETTKISGSCYISIDEPNSMFQIIDKLIELIH